MEYYFDIKIYKERLKNLNNFYQIFTNKELATTLEFCLFNKNKDKFKKEIEKETKLENFDLKNYLNIYNITCFNYYSNLNKRLHKNDIT